MTNMHGNLRFPDVRTAEMAIDEVVVSNFPVLSRVRWSRVLLVSVEPRYLELCSIWHCNFLV